MSNSELSGLDSAIAQLFRACELSFDLGTSDVTLQRIVPVTLFIDGDSDDVDAVAEDLRSGIGEILADNQFTVVGEWGPIYGSFGTTLFGRSDRPEYGPTFRKRLLKIRTQLAGLRSRVPDKVGEGLHAVLVVGTFVVHLAGPAAVAAALPVTVPIAVIEYAAIAAGAIESIEVLHRLLKPKPDKSIDFVL